MFPSLAEREIYVAETNFAARPKENAFALGQEHFCLAYTKFASEPSVSQFCQEIWQETMFPSLARPVRKFSYEEVFFRQS